MKLWSSSFESGQALDAAFAFCAVAPVDHVTFSGNKNPHLAWSDVPPATKSFALIVHDPDAPSQGDKVNREGESVPAELPRVDFFHWVLIDIPPLISSIAAASFAEGVMPRGKSGPDAGSPVSGARHGLNDYTGWFTQDAAMSGDYFGYDGPCPPWNDTIVHRYVFTLYALDIARLRVVDKFTGHAVREAIIGHELAQASIHGWYSLNPDVAIFGGTHNT